MNGITEDGNISIKVEELKKRKLFLGTPMFGGNCSGMFARSIADLAAICNAYGVQLMFYFLFNESLITRARSYVCDEFLRSDATHMLFIDADIGFKAQDVMAMLALMSDDTDYDVMAAPYPKKTIAWEKVVKAVNKGFADKDPTALDKFIGDYVFNPKPGITQFRVDRPVEVLEAGTGFMMIRRNTLVRFQEAYGRDYMYRPDHVRSAAFDGSREIMMFFQAEIDRHFPEHDFADALRAIAEAPNDPDRVKQIAEAAIAKAAEESKKHTKRYLSEDYWFSQLCQRIGMKIWFCPWMQTQHVGTMVFGGTLADLAALGAHPTADVGVIKK